MPRPDQPYNFSSDTWARSDITNANITVNPQTQTKPSHNWKITNHEALRGKTTTISSNTLRLGVQSTYMPYSLELRAYLSKRETPIYEFYHGQVDADSLIGSYDLYRGAYLNSPRDEKAVLSDGTPSLVNKSVINLLKELSFLVESSPLAKNSRYTELIKPMIESYFDMVK